MIWQREGIRKLREISNNFNMDPSTFIRDELKCDIKKIGIWYNGPREEPAIQSRPIVRGQSIVNVHRDSRVAWASPLLARKVTLFTGDGAPCRPLEWYRINSRARVSRLPRSSTTRPVIVSPVAARLPLLRSSRCAGIPQDVSLAVTQQPARRAGRSGDDGGGCGGGEAGTRFYCCLRKMTTRIFFSQFHWAPPGGPRGTPLAQSCLGLRSRGSGPAHWTGFARFHS